ncbi:MAG: ATP-binding protein [Rhodocyclaceae bacterium]|nr:ATP-binding protein [Rhodocyclaceae bacterium]
MVATFAAVSIMRPDKRPAPEETAQNGLDALGQDEMAWRSLKYFSYYRLAIAALFLVAAFLPARLLVFGEQAPAAYGALCGAYLVAGFLLLGGVCRKPRFSLASQVSLQALVDIVFLISIQHTSGGIRSGVAMLLLVAIAGASVVGQGRQAPFFAALATLGLLAEHALRVAWRQGDAADFLVVGLTSLSFFGVALMTRLMARRLAASNELARRRGVELADFVRINERVIRDMQDGVMVVDGQARVRMANPQAVRLLGIQDTLYIGSALEHCAPALAQIFHERCQQGLEYETMILAPRTGRTLRARFLPAGEGEASLFFLEDAGRRQQLAQQAKLAALGRLTANLAHEIRNPLAAISHAAELLRDEAPGDNFKRLVRIIGDNVLRLDHLVAEIQALGMRDQANAEEVQLRPLLEQVAEDLAMSKGLNRQRLALEVPHEATVCFDRSHLYRVLLNLLDNAMQFASDSPHAIRIFSEPGRNPGRIALHVVDDGPGIDEEGRGKIFEPFFTTRRTGMGLGLYIARELCEANGARLTLLENAPGAHFCLICWNHCPKAGISGPQHGDEQKNTTRVDRR